MDHVHRSIGDALVHEKSPVLILLGPTGSGKTKVSLELVSLLSSYSPVELVCMDSMQIYRELEIGNTAPSLEEKNTVKHHLFGHRSIVQAYSVVEWLNDVTQVIQEVHSRRKIPLLVGGTGLYYRILVEGISDVPPTPAKVRQRLDALFTKKKGPHLYRLLQRLDPAAAARLHPHDSQRIQRCLEVVLISGNSMLRFWDQGRNRSIRNPILTLGLNMPRELLRHRISDRLNCMLQQGWFEEVIHLEKNGLRPYVEKHGPLGYSILFRALNGEFVNFGEAVDQINVLTRQYSKRQMTWFQSISDIEWFNYQSETGYNSYRMFTKILEFMENGSNQLQEE